MLDNAVRHLGYQPEGLTEQEKIKLIQESQKRLARVKRLEDSSLTPVQRASLSLARAMVGQKGIAKISFEVPTVYAASIPPASDRVTTAGMYSRSIGEIFISLEQLERGREAVNTAIHELAHHTSGAEDGEPIHSSEISKIADQVVAATRRGDFDRYLSGVFAW